MGCLVCGILVLIVIFVSWWVLGAFKTSAGDLLRDIYEGLTGEQLTCEDLFALFLAALLGALMACCYCCCLVFWCFFGQNEKQYDRFEDEGVAKAYQFDDDDELEMYSAVAEGVSAYPRRSTSQATSMDSNDVA